MKGDAECNDGWSLLFDISGTTEVLPIQLIILCQEIESKVSGGSPFIVASTGRMGSLERNNRYKLSRIQLTGSQ